MIVFVKYYICLGFLWSIYSLQMISNIPYPSILGTIRQINKQKKERKSDRFIDRKKQPFHLNWAEAHLGIPLFHYLYLTGDS